MTRPNRGKIITPPNHLKMKAKDIPASSGEVAIRKAEAAMKKISADIAATLFQDLDNIKHALEDFRQKHPVPAPEKTQLYHLAFETKGLAGSLGYDLIGDICASLCEMLDKCPQEHKDYLAGLAAHIHALQVVLTSGQNTTTSSGEALAILAGLRQVVLKISEENI
tara:strand:- start:3395 stop:3892 length:498 start_codon:yes stop_codon:yes gene_type:complete